MACCVDSMESAVLEAAGVTAEVFQKSLLAHQHNQLLQQTVMAMQVTTNALLSLCLPNIVSHHTVDGKSAKIGPTRNSALDVRK